jgi:hypothetical protein
MLELFQIHFRILARLLTKRSGGPSPEAWAGAFARISWRLDSLISRHMRVTQNS